MESESPEDLLAIRHNAHALHMEGLAIRERVLGQDNPDLPHPIVFRGAVFADAANFDKCLNLWLHALRIRLKNKAGVMRDLLR